MNEHLFSLGNSELGTSYTNINRVRSASMSSSAYVDWDDFSSRTGEASKGKLASIESCFEL